MSSTSCLSFTHTASCAALLLTLALASCNDDKSANPTVTGSQQPGVTYTITFDSNDGTAVAPATVE